MLRNHRVLAIKLGVLAIFGGVVLFIDRIPPAIGTILGVIWLAALFLVTGLEMASGIHQDTSDRSLSELIRESRDQDSSPH